MIATVVTRGFGSFGSTTLIATRGYSIGAAFVVTSTGIVAKATTYCNGTTANTYCPGAVKVQD